MSFTCVYEIVNTISGMRYIGSTKNYRTRFSQHKQELKAGVHANASMQKDWNTFGREVFSFNVVTSVLNAADLFLMEQVRLDDAAEEGTPLFNVHKYSDSSRGRLASEETKRKMSIARVGKPRSAESIEKVAIAHRGMKRSKETCEKLSAMRRGKKMHPNCAAALLKANKGRAMTEAQKKAISLALTGKVRSEETRKRMSEAKTGKPGTPLTEAQKQHLSNVVKARRAKERQDRIAKVQPGWNPPLNLVEI